MKVALASAALRRAATDDLRFILYRPELFGAHVAPLAQHIFRGPSEWTVGEREIFAALVAQYNTCSFCRSFHAQIAAEELGEELVEQILADAQSAPISSKLKSAITFLEKLTLRPTELGPADVQRVRNAGVSDDGIETMLLACYIMGAMNKIADALGFAIPPPEALSRAASIIYKMGYRT